jgi:DNA-binding NarL/FixJ family response regulator
MKVLLVDDHAVVLKGLSFYLSTQSDIEIVGEAYNGQEAISKVEKLGPDIVLMDLVMPIMDGVTATTELKKIHPELKILVLTSVSDQAYVIPALRAGAIGYLLKDMKPEQLVEAIRGAYSGNVQLHPDISSQLMSSVGSIDSTENRLVTTSFNSIFDELTLREKEVLQLIAKGMSNKEIASNLFIAEKTVKSHVSNILSKLELGDRTQAALFAVKHGFTID